MRENPARAILSVGHCNGYRSTVSEHAMGISEPLAWHSGSFVLVQSSLCLEYSLQLFGHLCFPVCDMHLMLINGDSKYKSLCAQHSESQGAISFSVLEKQLFSTPGGLTISLDWKWDW